MFFRASPVFPGSALGVPKDDEAPAAERLALVIARSGPAGVTLDGLRRVVRLSPETLHDLLRTLTAAGQVTALKVNGRMTYRAAA
jgi:DNA-binding IclR family transcriptional regulator